ncbi:MAG: hypothetical protein DHS20C21_18560 [Gemmatimonadota bacterium]|nr:MAG: hypothetical protein DHS20C21_18560 [Gemmatimonadota bacterium]
MKRSAGVLPASHVAVIPVAFPDEPDSAHVIDWVEMTDAMTGFQTYIDQLSRGGHSVQVSYLPDPATGKRWIADETAATYKSTNYQGPYADCTNPLDPQYDLYEGHGVHELQAEILYKVANAYAPFNPFQDMAEDITTILFVHNDRIFKNADVGGLGRLRLTQSATIDTTDNGVNDPVTCLDFLPANPICNQHEGAYPDDPLSCYGMTTLWVNEANAYPHHRTDFEHIFAHEFGHLVLSLGHNGEWEGVYNCMKPDLLRWQGYIPYSEGALASAGWLDEPTMVTPPVSGLKIYDVRSDGAAYAVAMGHEVVQDFPTVGQLRTTQQLMLTYHAGVGPDAELNKDGDPLYPSTGIKARHAGAIYWDPEGPVEESFASFGYGAMEPATGRFADPGVWTIPDPVNGYHNLQEWPGRPDLDLKQYTGDPADFYSTDPGRNELSFRTNPLANPADVPTFGNLPTSMMLFVREQGEDAGGKYAVVDVLAAPEETILSPAGGACYAVGDTIHVTWTVDPTLQIDSVDVDLSTNGGASYTPLASVAHTGTYAWAATSGQTAANANVRLTFHNTITSVTSSQVSATFSVGQPVKAHNFHWSNNADCTETTLTWDMCRAAACKVEWGPKKVGYTDSTFTGVGASQSITISVPTGKQYNCRITPLVADGVAKVFPFTTMICGNGSQPVIAQLPTDLQVHPNPARGDVRLRFSVPTVGDVRLDIFDVTGRRIRTLTEGPRATGYHEVYWNRDSNAGERVSPGIYFARLASDEGRQLKKVVLLD